MFVGNVAAEREAAVAHERARFAAPAQAERFELEQHDVGEAVVDLAGSPCRAARTPAIANARGAASVRPMRNRSARFVMSSAGYGMTFGAAEDHRGRVRADRARCSAERHDDRGRAVGLEAAVEQAERLADPRATRGSRPS